MGAWEQGWACRSQWAERKGHLGWVGAIRRVYNVTVAHVDGVCLGGEGRNVQVCPWWVWVTVSKL